MTIRKPTPRETFFIVVLVAFGIVYLAYKDEGGLFGGGAEEARKPRAVGIAPIVHMAELSARTEAYDPQGRNLFEYYTPPPPPRAKPAVRPQQQQTQPKVQPTRQAPTRAMQDRAQVNAGLQPPKINFKYLGFLGPKDDKIAVFENGEEMLLARAGETIEQDFKVVEFKYESVVMGYVDNRFKDMTTELNMRRN
jgi:hypothetical protein